MNTAQLLRAELRSSRSQRAKRLITGDHLVVDFAESHFPTVELTYDPAKTVSTLTIHWMRHQGCAIALAAVVPDGYGDGMAAIAEGPELPVGVDFEKFAARGIRSSMTTQAHPYELAVAAAEALGVASVTIHAQDVPPPVGDQLKRWIEVSTDVALANVPRINWSLDGRDPHPNLNTPGVAAGDLDPTRLFLSVNPNAIGTLGHFVGFDERIRDQLDGRMDFASLGHESLDPEAVPHWIIPAFSFETSAAVNGNRSPVTRQFIAAEWPKLRPVLADIARFYDQAHVFWYLGCAEFIPLIEHASELFPAITWHLHLFWDFRLADDDPAAMARFASLTARAQRLPNVHLSIGSEAHRRLLKDRLAIDIDYFPAGPSVNLSDAESHDALGAAKAASPANAFFPSNHSVGKNWALSARAALMLQNQEDPEFASLHIRVIHDQLPEQHQGLAEQLRACPNITVLEGSLSAEELTGRIGESGVIGLPYTPEWFRYRTSGLLTEAIVQGCRVVCLDETNLAEVVRRTNSGTVTSADPSTEEFAAALADERRAVHELTTDRRTAWFETTSWRAVTAAALLPASRTTSGRFDG